MIASIRLLVCLLAAAAGCLAPQAGPATQPARSGENPSNWETNLGPQPTALDWLPIVGRAGSELQQRHGLDATRETLVLQEEFDQVTGSYVPGWQITGFPSIRQITLDQAAGLELRAPADVKESCGLERPLNTERVAGRDVRVDVRLTCRSFIRAEAMGKTRISLTARDREGRSAETALPLEIGVSPGWEWQHFWVRLQPDVSDVRLKIAATEPGGVLTLDAIRVTAGPAIGRPIPGSPAPTENLIPDGDFETGSARFFASGSTRWPNGDERVVPLSWQITNDSSVGGNSLAVYLSQPIGRIGFGPLDLSMLLPGGSKRLFLSFMARAFRPTTVAATLRTRTRHLGRATYSLTGAWQRFAGGIEVQADTFEQRLDLAGAELVFEFAGDEVPEANMCGLDAVVLQTSPIMPRYTPSSSTEIGLTGPGHDSTDLWNLFDAQEPVSFGLRLVGGPALPPTTQAMEWSSPRPIGQVAIDLLDAWDRVAARQTRALSMVPGGVHSEWIELGVLPRGYYRVLATLWDGTPGKSKLISQTSMPLAVVSLRDPVPAMGLFGLSTWDGNVSTRTTALGSAWVRVEMTPRRCRSRTGQWDLSTWQAILGQCQRARVDVVADVDLPGTPDARLSFLENWLMDAPFSPIGVIVRPPAIGRRSGSDYLQQLEEVRKLVAPRLPNLRAVEDLSFLDGLPDPVTPALRSAFGSEAEPQAQARREASGSKTDGRAAPVVWGMSGRESPLPENREGYLEAIGRRRPQNTEVWELNATVRLGATATLGCRPLLNPEEAGTGGPIALLEPPVDPVRSASRMVRSILIRILAGANMVCSEATALAPPRSVHDDDHQWLHERDLSPRAAVVAFDLAAELLNNASPARWIDLPGGVRVLYFEKDDGRAAAAFWRPYGLAATRVSFPALPASASAFDCLGVPTALVAAGDRQVLEVNEFVRYLLAPADQRETLRRALDKIAVETVQPPLPGEAATSAPSTRPIR